MMMMMMMMMMMINSSSGNIVVNSIDYGMFVVRPDWEAIESIPKNSHMGFRQRSRELLDSTLSVSCRLEEYETCEASVEC